MECPKCGASNAPLKKTCYNCGAVLSGWTVNNVTGEYGYRNSNGSFTKEPKRLTEDPKSRIVGVSFNHKDGIFSIKLKSPIGYLRQTPTDYTLAVYKPISRFKRLVLGWCFGLKYEKI